MKNLKILVNGKYLSDHFKNVSGAYICEVYTKESSLFLKPVSSVNILPFNEVKSVNTLENVKNIFISDIYEDELNEFLETFNKDIHIYTDSCLSFNNLKKLDINSLIYMKTQEYLINLIKTIDDTLENKLNNLEFNMHSKITNGKMYFIDIIKNKEVLNQVNSFDYDSLFKISFNLAKGIFDFLSDNAYLIDIRINSNCESLIDGSVSYNQDLQDDDWQCIKNYNNYKFTFKDKKEYRMKNFYYGSMFDGRFSRLNKDELLKRNLVNLVDDELDQMIKESFECVLSYFNPLKEVEELLESKDLKDKVTFITRKWKDWYAIPLFKVTDFNDDFVSVDNLNYYNNAQYLDISLVYHKKLSYVDILETENILKNAYDRFLNCIYSDVDFKLKSIK